MDVNKKFAQTTELPQALLISLEMVEKTNIDDFSGWS